MLCGTFPMHLRVHRHNVAQHRPGLASTLCVLCTVEDETSEHVFLRCVDAQVVQVRRAGLDAKLKIPVLGATTIEQLVARIDVEATWRRHAVGDARESGTKFSVPYSLYHFGAGLVPAAVTRRLDQRQLKSMLDAMQRSFVCIRRMWLSRCDKKHRGSVHAGQ